MSVQDEKIKSFMEERTCVFVWGVILAFVLFSIALISKMSAFSFIIYSGIWTGVIVVFVLDMKATMIRILNNER